MCLIRHRGETPCTAPVGGGTDGREQDAAADERTVGRGTRLGQGENQMAWVQHMNSLKAQAEEMILTELITAEFYWRRHSHGSLQIESIDQAEKRGEIVLRFCFVTS